jgi:hypothetical protein
MIRAEAFVAIEEGLTNRLTTALSEYTMGLYKQIELCLLDNRFQEARDLVQTLSLEGLFADHETFVRYSTNLAMLFGASRVTPKPGTSVVGLGYQKLMVEQAVMGLSRQFGPRAEESLRETALQLIALREGTQVEKAEGDEPRIIKEFASFMDEKGKAQFNLISSLHTSRVSAYGFTAEANAMGYTEYVINEQLDKHTCPVCRLMHGKRFKVSDAQNLLEMALYAKDPADLKHIQPWPSQSKASVAEMTQMTTQQLVGQGWHVPPFHPRCRGLLARVGKAPSLQQIEQNTANEPYVTSKEDFESIGVKVPPSKLDTWNQTFDMPPAEILGRQRGVSLPDYLAEVHQYDKPSDYTGLKSLKIGSTITTVAQAVMYGSAEPVTHGLSFSWITKKAIITALNINESMAPAKVVKKYVTSVVSLARDIGMEEVVIGVGSMIDAVAAVKMGFLPRQNAWNILRKKLLNKTKGNPLFSKLMQDSQNLIIDALTDSSPVSIRVLLYSAEGMLLLSGENWVASLMVDNQDAMSMFVTD